MSHVTIMVGDQPSTKHYTVDTETDRPRKGQVKTSYYHDSYTVPVNNLADLYEVIESVRENPNAFIIRGHGKELEQNHVLRRLEDPANFHEVATQWICCDFDAEITPVLDPNSLEAIEWLIWNKLPEQFRNVDCIFQWSNSAGLSYKGHSVKEGTNVHLFFWLSRPLSNTELKQWFKPQHEEGFDISTFNTVTPIFVGSHIVRETGIEDLIPSQNKFGILPYARGLVQVPEIDVNTVENFILKGMEMPEDTISDIMRQLYSLGAIYKSTGGWYKLKHPREKTPGDWHIRKTDPTLVHHHVHKSKRIDNWIRDFYGVEATFTITKPEVATGVSGLKLLQKQRKMKYGKAF